MVGKLFSTEGRSPGAFAALVVLVTVVAYLPVRNAGFVFDDSRNVTVDQSLRTVQGLRRIWTDPRAPHQYYPLTYTSFWVEYHLWGLRPAGYHMVNVLLHAVNGVLVGLLLSRLAVPGAWVAALLFAVHPVHVESVAWVSERKNVLSGVFYLSSLLTYLRFGEGPRRRWGFYVVSLALFVCALLSKTSAVSLPLAIWLVLWWQQRRSNWQVVVTLIPFLLAGAALGLLTAWVEVHYSGAHGPEWQLSWVERCLVAGRVVWFYAGKLIWPYPLMIIYPRWQVNTAVWWQYLFPCAAGAVVLALWWWRERLGKATLVGVVFFVATLAPVPAFMNISFMRHSYVADHWQYLSSIGLIAVAAAAGEKIWRRMGKQRRRFGAVAGAAVLVVLVVATWRRSGVYADDERFWRDSVTKNPNAWLAHNGLGAALQTRGRFGDAIGQYEQALRLNPNCAEPHNNWGAALFRTGKIQEAIGHYEQALRLNADYAEAHNNLAVVLAQTGRTREAIGHWEQALRINPDYAEAHYNLGIALVEAGRLQEAIGHYEQALRLNPNYAEAHYNLGVALVRLGRGPEAVGHWEQALRIKPDYAEAHANLGVALEQAGRVPEAIGHYEQALRLKPDFAEVRNRLARLRTAQ